MKKLRVPKVIKEFGRFFQRHGFSVYLVGGAVRNMVLGHIPTDYDFATDAGPEDVMKIFRSVIPTGIKHGTVTVLFKGNQFEVTTFRVEGTYSNARHPDSIQFTPSLFEDLKRRDFTINSMAVDLVNGELIDPHDGRADLKRHVIRAIGDPLERFKEDGLRLMRACRFAAQLQFDIEEDTFHAMQTTVGTIRQVSAERIRDELMKILKAPKPSLGLYAMEKTGLLSIVLPELSACRGVEQGGIHAYDVFDHSLKSCDGAPAGKPMVRLAALLHDIGKPQTKEEHETKGLAFHRHELIAADMCHEIMRRFRFSKDDEQKVCLLVRHHMFHYQSEWSDGAVRRFISTVGQENIEELFDLRLADQYGMQGVKPRYDSLSELRDRIDQVVSQEDALSIKDLAVNGHMLNSEAGIPKGPDMGTVLEHLLETVMDDPEMNEKKKLLTLARSFYTNYIQKQTN